MLFFLLIPLNRGSFGEVKKAKNKVTGEEIAVKIINK